VSALWILLALAGAGLAWWAREKSRRRTHPVPPGYRPEIRIPYRQEFELYHNALSLCSMKTRVCLAELGISYASHHVDLIETGTYENIRPAFLAVNPGGTVPVLVRAGHPVYESHEQIRYAAEHAPPGSPSLLPAEPALREEMQRWIERSSLTDEPLRHGHESAANAVPGITLPLFAAMIREIPIWKIAEGLLFHFDRRRPLVFLVFKAVGLARLGRITPAMKLLARSRAQLHLHLDALEKQLREGRGPWLLGAEFSLADVSWLVIFERLRQADFLQVFVASRPECAGYWERLRRRPSYREAILAHGHPTIARGSERLRRAKAADPALRTALEGA
jgi:glutathione S-transferase